MRRISFQQGFSLVELSITLVIVGLLTSGIITGTARFRKNLEVQEVREKLYLIHDALIGYAMANGRLPCPDHINFADGNEDFDNTDTSCLTDFGFLPYRDLGISGVITDPWGSRYAYRVDAEFADNIDGTTDNFDCPASVLSTVGVSFEICAHGEIAVHDIGGVANGGACVPPACNVIAETVPAIFYSFGPNGLNTQSVHELENMMDNVINDPGGIINDPNERIFVQRQYSDSLGEVDTRFDDQVMWISPYVLINSLVQARRLP